MKRFKTGAAQRSGGFRRPGAARSSIQIAQNRQSCRQLRLQSQEQSSLAPQISQRKVSDRGEQEHLRVAAAQDPQLKAKCFAAQRTLLIADRMAGRLQRSQTLSRIQESQSEQNCSDFNEIACASALIIQSFARDSSYGSIGAEPMAAVLKGGYPSNTTEGEA